jgi:hypothetical protein
LLDPHVGFHGWLAPDSRMFVPPWYPLVASQSKPTSKLPYRKLQYPTYMKVLILMLTSKFSKKKIKTNREIMEVDIINLFGLTLQDNISKWGKNFLQDHPNYTFEELEQMFYKRFQIVKNNKEIYM